MTSIETTGNLGREPELKYANSGTPFLSFTLADTPRKKNEQTGEWEDAGQTMWLACTLWGADAEHYAGQLAKGRRVTVYGTLTVRDYTTTQGEARQSLDVRVDALKVHEQRGQQRPQQAPQSSQGYGQPQGGYGTQQPVQAPQANPWQQPASDEPPF